MKNVWPLILAAATLVSGCTMAKLRPIRSLDDAPKPESYVQQGLDGLYAGLRAAEPATPPEGSLAPYQPYESPTTPANAATFNIRQIVVKFAEGTAIRLLSGALVISEAEGARTRARLTARRGLEPQTVVDELTVFRKLLMNTGAVPARAAPQIGEADLARLRLNAELSSRREHADLDLFYFVHLPKGNAEAAQRVLASIKRLRIVEAAYFQPIPFDAADVPPQTTINVTGTQGYFRSAPTGIDVDYARLLSGGRGDSVRIADIESSWYPLHEDLPRIAFGFGVNWGGSHGTAVLGQIAAEDNGFGATGIAPNAVIGWSSVTQLDPFFPTSFYSVANALLMTGRVLQPGDIALIEQHFQVLTDGFICNQATDPCRDCSIPTWRAVEEFAHEHAAISQMTAAGIIVVEAAGNGRMLVIPASSADSGAIVVGAGNFGRAPFCWSNFGPRVNVQGWGGGIGSTGYGEMTVVRRDAAGKPVLDATGTPIIDTVPDPTLRANGGDPNQWYTTNFGGTSGASPIVVGAAAIIQSTRTAVGLPKLTSIEMRTLLAATGTPQAPGTTPNIGPQPDLRRAIATYLPDVARFVSQTAAPTNPVAPGAIIPMTETFSNSGGGIWTGGHTLSISPSAQSGKQEFFGTTVSLGSAIAPVNPGVVVTGQFQVSAPAQAGTYHLSFVLQNGAGQRLAVSPSQQVVVAAPGATAVDNAALSVKSAPGSLRNGQADTVTVTAKNTGSTTWLPGSYSLRLQRGLRVALPQTSAALGSAVAPGASLDISFGVSCNGSGQGWFSAQMSGPGGRFAQIASRTIVCQR